MSYTEVERNLTRVVCCARNVLQSTETRLTSTLLPGLFSEITQYAFI